MGLDYRIVGLVLVGMSGLAWALTCDPLVIPWAGLGIGVACLVAIFLVPPRRLPQQPARPTGEHPTIRPPLTG